MRTRYAFFVFLCLFITFPFKTTAGNFFLSVYGGATKAEMKEYNDSIATANSHNASLGIQSTLKTLELAIAPDINFGYDFMSVIGLYVRTCGIVFINGESKVYWPSGLTAQKMKSDFSTFYTGIGVRYNFQDKSNPFFTGYIAADGGLCHYYGNYMEEASYKEDGGILYSIRKDWNTAIPAGSVEAGLNWWFCDVSGIGIKAGYRLAYGKVMVDITNIYGWTGENQGISNVDYSGAYINAGFVFRFDDSKNKLMKIEVPSKDGQFPEISAKLYSEAVDYYEEGLLHRASEKIDQAANTDSNDEKINELKVKIDLILKTEKVSVNADKLIKQADELRIKMQYKKARAIYLEVLAISKNNQQAEFYIKEFDGKAEEYYSLAVALQSAGDNDKAFSNVCMAAQYNPENETVLNLLEELKKLVNSEKNVVKKYNKAVEKFKHGRYQEAIELWDEVLLVNPNDKEAYDNKEKAMKKIEENISEKTVSVEKAIKQAQNLFNIGKIEEAKIKCEFVLRLEPENEQGKKLFEAIKVLNEANKVEVITKR